MSANLELPADLADSGLVNLATTEENGQTVSVGFRANVAQGAPLELNWAVDGDEAARLVLVQTVIPRIRSTLGIYEPVIETPPAPAPVIELAPEAAQNGAPSPAAEVKPDAKPKTKAKLRQRKPA